MGAPVEPTHQHRLSGATGLHKGDRAYQQDQVALIAHPRVKGSVMALVTDGMGGKSGGRKAADQILMVARHLFEAASPGNESASVLLTTLVRQAHVAVKLTAVTADAEPHGTLAAFLIEPNRQCHIVHAGDSRIYHFRGGRLLARTKDHSYVQQMVDRGEITQDEATNHPRSNVLIGCIGGKQEPPLDIASVGELQIGDTLLACSDGLWHYYTDTELGQITSRLAPKDASRALVEEARVRAGGQGDNISLAIVKIEHRPPPELRL